MKGTEEGRKFHNHELDDLLLFGMYIKKLAMS